MEAQQLSFDIFGNRFDYRPPLVAAAIQSLAEQGGMEARGAIFTRLEVVDFILDLVGYTEDQPLHRKRLLEPSFGGGDFLLPAISRLLGAWHRDGHRNGAASELGDAIRAVELHRDTFHSTREAVLALPQQRGI